MQDQSAHHQTDNMPGETGAVTVSCPTAMTMAAFFGISAYNVLEIQVSIFNVFKRRRCLYFWSMEVASWTILMHGLPIFLRFAPKLPMCVLIVIGRWGMVTGQSVVLYSRLQLVVEDARRIRWVLYMIIFNFFALQIPTSILFFGENLGYLPFLPAFNIYERLQLTGFCLQESIISGLYIWEGSRALKPVFAMRGRSGRDIMIHLILVNVLVVAVDGSLLATEYSDNFEIQTTYKPLV